MQDCVVKLTWHFGTRDDSWVLHQALLLQTSRDGPEDRLDAFLAPDQARAHHNQVDISISEQSKKRKMHREQMDLQGKKSKTRSWVTDPEGK